MSSAERHPKQIFLDAVEHYSPEQWPDYLNQACGDDADLRRRVEVLLAAHVADQSLLESPAVAPPATIVQPQSETIGTVIGPYKLLQQIGEGGMGTVYLAEQSEPVERRVALKVIKPGMDSRQVIARFEAERQALALMDHPNIARVLDAGTTDAGRPYFVMELVKGVPITRYCDEQHLTPRQRLELFVPVCQAVQHAHQKGVIHRDLKPSNVLIALYDPGAPGVPKVIDFGVAKATGHKLTDHTMFTELGQVVGTLEYMSPEQAEFNQLDIDTRSDIYSLGVLLYELLTGTTPFEKKRLKEAALVELLRIIREEEPQKPSTRLSTTAELASIAANRGLEPKRLSGLVRGDLDWIVMKALEKDRSRRYETANGFAADVLRYLADEPVTACPPSAAYRFKKFARRNKGALATGALVSTALVATVVVLAVSNVLVTRERNAKVQALGEKQAALTQSQANLTEAKRQEGLANEQKQIATEQTALAKRRFYASQMNLAMQAWRAGEVPRVLELLEGQRPGPDEEDLRGFEWYYLWRLCNAGRRLYLHGHSDAVTALAYSPDGKTLASASWDRTVRLWDTVTGHPKSTLHGHTRGVWEVAYSPDGKTLASSGQETQSLILWDVATGKPLHTIAGSVLGLAFSRDSSIIAGGLYTESGVHLKIWDVASGEERFTLADAGMVIGFLRDEKILVTVSGRYAPTAEVQFWDLETETQRLKISVPHIRNAVLSTDGTRVATVSGNVTLWDTTTGQRQASFPQPSGGRALAFSPDGKFLAGGSEDRTVTVWEVETGRQIAQDVHLDPVWGVAFSPDGKTLASSTLAGAVKLWDMTPAVESATITGVGGVTSLRFDTSGRTLLVGNSGPTKVIDVAAGKEAALLPASGVMAISADANVLAGPGDVDQSAIWDVRDGRTTASIPLPHPPDTYPGLALSPDGTLVATYYERRGDNTLKLWDAATQEVRLLKPDPPGSNNGAVNCAEFSPDGRLLAAGFQFQWVTVWDVATGNVKLQFSQPPAMMWVLSVAFSPDGKTLAVGTDNGAVTLWEVESGKRLASFRGHTLQIRALAFSPDGKTLATGGQDRTVRLWDVVTGQERCTLTAHQGLVVNVRFSPDGNTLATAGSDGTVKLWRAATDPEALARRASVAADDPHYVIAREYNWSAWHFAMTDKVDERDPAKAVELAQQAIALFPQWPGCWMTLGVARYRAGEWQAAIVALDKSEDLAPGEYVYKGFFRAMALWQLGDSDHARNSYERASEWLAQRAPHDPSFRQFQSEAAALLGLPAPPTPNLALPPGAISREQQIAELLSRRAALDERAAAAPTGRWERWQLAKDYHQLAVDLRDRDLEQFSEAEAVCRQALDAFRTLADEDPHEIQFDYDVGWASQLVADALMRRRRFEEAVPLAREALARFQAVAEIRPDRPEYREWIVTANGLLAYLLEQLNQPEEAAQAKRDMHAARQQAQELRTLPSVEDLLNSARPFAETRDWAQAAAELNKGYERQHRSNTFLCFSTALVQLLAGDIEGYARLVDGMPTLRSLKLERGERLDVLRTSTLHPRGAADPAALMPLARATYDEAANNWNAQNLGMLHYRAGEFDEALRRMEEAQKLGEWFIFYPALAMTDHQLGHPEEARVWLEKADTFLRDLAPPAGERLKTLKDDPLWQDWAYFEVMLQEARTLIGETGELTETELRTAVQHRPESAVLQRQLGLLLQNEGRLAEAEPFLREVVRLAPGRYEAHAELAEVLRRQQKPAGAETVQREAIRLSAGHAWMHERLGWLLWEQNKFADAELAFRESLRLKPDVWGAQWGLGKALQDQNKLAEAVAPLREVIRLDPTLHYVHGALGWVLLEQRLLPEAEAEFREQVRLSPDSAVGHFGLGRTLLDQEKFADAEQELRETLRLDPTDRWARELLGQALVGQGQLAEAESVLTEAVRRAPERVELHTCLADVLRRQQKFAGAETVLNEAIRRDPGQAWVHDRLGWLLWEQKEFAAAESAFREAVRLMPDLISAQSGLTDSLRKQKKFREALVPLRESVRMEPGNHQTHGQLGWTLIELGEFADAESAFREQVRLKPGLGDGHSGLGRALQEQKEFAEAIEALREATRLDPMRHDFHGRLGWLLFAQQLFPEAEAEFREQVRLKPDAAGGHSGLGKALVNQRKFSDAEAALREAIRLDPTQIPAHEALGWSSIRQQQFAAAELAFREVIRLKPDSAGGQSGLGRALVEQQQFAAAENALREALRLDPARRDAPDLLNRALVGQGKPPEAKPPEKPESETGRQPTEQQEQPE